MSVFSGGVNYYPFNAGRVFVGEWVQWNYADGPLTIFANGPEPSASPVNLPVQSIWVPVLNSPITVTDSSGTNQPYTTLSSGEEVIPVDTGQFSVTLSAPATTGSVFIYVSSQPFNPFRLGPTASQVTNVTATAPIVSSGGATPNISIATPIPLNLGGTGTAAPAGVIAGSGVTVTGSFPNQTVAATSGTVGSVGASAPLASSGGTNPNISIATPIPLNLGGTGTSNPALSAGPGINVKGNIFQSGGPSAWTVTNIGVTSIDGQSGDVTTNSKGGIQVSGAGSGVVTVDTTALPWTIASGTSGIINITQSGPHNQTNTFDIASHYQFHQTQFAATSCLLKSGTTAVTTGGTAIGGAWEFTSPPIVVATVVSASATNVVWSVSGISNTGATLTVSTNATLNWFAFGQG